MRTPEQQRAYNLAYRAKHRDALKAYDRSRRSSPEQKAARCAHSKAWYEADREAISARRKIVAATSHHRAYQKAANKSYYAKNREALRVYSRAYHAEHRVEANAKAAAYNEANRATLQANGRAYYAANRAKRLADVKAYVSANPSKKTAWHAKRRASKRRATVPWANQSAIAAIYADAARLTLETGIKHHVDHFYPLVSPLVCGLHVEHNLQILKDTENMQKHNKHPDRLAA